MQLSQGGTANKGRAMTALPTTPPERPGNDQRRVLTRARCTMMKPEHKGLF